jgi:hypothetical protein
MCLLSAQATRPVRGALVQKHVAQQEQARRVARVLFLCDHGRARLGLVPARVARVWVELRARAERRDEVRQLRRRRRARQRRRDGGDRRLRGRAARAELSMNAMMLPQSSSCTSTLPLGTAW